ncbi:hypothetical protein POM88_007486 [Heracleum sosnowskyi]|uniref:Uncharacterized protein n=1 Tax=Heracleum sosnowskyi TaxID=360622 RepID=A0AAD8N7L5_9APIA|nr:hypothetical protein POM88_007486 [Heracleum sosnowskyi]
MDGQGRKRTPLGPHSPSSAKKDRGVQAFRPSNSCGRKTQINSGIVETSDSAKRKENRKYITVTVPDVEQLSIPLPAWYPPNKDSQASVSEVKKKDSHASSSGVRNLMSSFNDVGESLNERDANDEEMLFYEDYSDSDEESHRGEYVSDDELDPSLDMSGKHLLP